MGCVFSSKHWLTGVGVGNPGPEGGGVRRWSLGEVIRSEGGALMNEISALIRDPRELPCTFLPGEGTAKSLPSRTRE